MSCTQTSDMLAVSRESRSMRCPAYEERHVIKLNVRPLLQPAFSSFGAPTHQPGVKNNKFKHQKYNVIFSRCSYKKYGKSKSTTDFFSDNLSQGRLYYMKECNRNVRKKIGKTILSIFLYLKLISYVEPHF